MKTLITTTLILFLSAFFYAQTANSASLRIYGTSAKKIYKSLTGPAVQNDGAAGHLYRRGKSILCRYTNADMDDIHGHNIPVGDPRRYACSIKFNINGFATPGTP